MVSDIELSCILKRLTNNDIELLTLAHNDILDNEWLLKKENSKYKKALICCKARKLIVPLRSGTIEWYELSPIGQKLLQFINKKKVI